METLCGQAYGAHKYDMLGIYLQRSVILLGLTGIPLAVMYALSEPLLLLMGQSPEIARAASIFVYGLIPQIFAYAVNFPIQKFLQAQSKVAALAWIGFAALIAHVGLLALFVSLLGWGVAGAAEAFQDDGHAGAEGADAGVRGARRVEAAAAGRGDGGAFLRAGRGPEAGAQGLDAQQQAA